MNAAAAEIILHTGDWSPACSACGRGTLQWAEAGYVPWHRICDDCGAHWDLHPLGLGIALLGDQADTPGQWIDGRGWVALDLDAPIQESGRTWRELVALLTPAHIAAARADKDQTMGTPCVPACWARRVR